MPHIPVIGIGTRTPFGIGPRKLIDGLCEARPMFARYEPFATAGMKFPVAASVPDEARQHGVTGAWGDRGTQLLEAAVRDALEDATGKRSLEGFAAIPRTRIALIAGTSSSGIGPFCAAQRSNVPPTGDDGRYASSTHDVARALGIGGPVMVICSVCASGAIAVAEAAQLVEDGAVDIAIAVGFDPLEPFVGAGFDSLSALTELPRPFRADRRGLALGEGSAAMILARTVPAGQTSRGVVLGWGGSSDAHHLTAPDPQGRGVALAIERALALAGASLDAVGVVNAHGTGTPYNDAMESAALTRVFGARAGERPVYTVKGTIGHTLGAAGAIEAVVSFAAMGGRIVPPTATSDALDPKCDLNLVTGRAMASSAAVTLSLSSAFGGTNCALLLGAPGSEVTT